MPIVAPPVHFAASDHIDAGDFLFNDRRLSGAKLCILEVALGELAHRHHAIHRLIPARDAVGADHGRRVTRISWHWLNSPTQFQLR